MGCLLFIALLSAQSSYAQSPDNIQESDTISFRDSIETISLPAFCDSIFYALKTEDFDSLKRWTPTYKVIKLLLAEADMEEMVYKTMMKAKTIEFYLKKDYKKLEKELKKSNFKMKDMVLINKQHQIITADTHKYSDVKLQVRYKNKELIIAFRAIELSDNWYLGENLKTEAVPEGFDHEAYDELYEQKLKEREKRLKEKEKDRISDSISSAKSLEKEALEQKKQEEQELKAKEKADKEKQKEETKKSREEEKLKKQKEKEDLKKAREEEKLKKQKEKEEAKKAKEEEKLKKEKLKKEKTPKKEPPSKKD